MIRNLKALAMLLTLPVLAGFAVVVAYALIGIDRDASVTYDRVYCYAFGVIMGWWLWGAR